MKAQTRMFEDRRVRVKDIVSRLGESVRTFYRRVAAGQYPPLHKDGRISFWLESTLERVLRGVQR